MAKNENRWRCLVTGCNPKLYGQDAAEAHRDETGHRVAKWPVRSAEGERRARIRNKTGYYDKYNVGAKSYRVRFRSRPMDGGVFNGWYDDDDHSFSPEALGQD